MPRVLLCPACGKKLKVPDAFSKATAKCPGCGETVGIPPAAPPAAPDPPPAPAPPQNQYAFADEHGAPARRPALFEDDGPSRKEPAPRADADRPRKKRRKRRPAEASKGPAPWLRWAVALGVYVLVLFCAGLAFALAGHHEAVIVYAVKLAIMIPLSTTILIASMVISSSLMGGIAFGEVHVVILKTALLILLVASIGQLPLEGVLAYAILAPLTLLIWLLGLMYFFDLDFMEARVLIIVNWGLNTVVQTVLLHIMIAALLREPGPAGPGGAPDPKRPPAQVEKDWPR